MSEYKCDCCNFSTRKQSLYTRHINSKKHKNNMWKLIDNQSKLNGNTQDTTQVNHNSKVNINNNNIDNNVYNNICLVGCDEENIAQLTNKHHDLLLNMGNKYTQDILNIINFSENKEEEINRYVSKLNNGYVLYNEEELDVKPAD